MAGAKEDSDGGALVLVCWPGVIKALCLVGLRCDKWAFWPSMRILFLREEVWSIYGAEVCRKERRG